MNHPGLLLDGIEKRFSHNYAVKSLSLSVEEGMLLSLLGPSGCGKTTTLRIIAGFEQADRGRVVMKGQDISALPPRRRRLGMVFQNYSLFPHMTVEQNIAFGLRMQDVSRSEMGTLVKTALDMVRLASHAAKLPAQLSGGQQQRVALARSLITNPSLLLLDEPLGALDKNLREEMQFELRHLQKSAGITTILVTHDQEEALTMSDQIAVLRDGELLQVASPDDIYNRPASRFVAEFLGTSNIFEIDAMSLCGDYWQARCSGLDAVLHLSEGRLSRRRGDGTSNSAKPHAVSVRPEKTMLSRVPVTGPNAVPGTVIGHVFRGTHHAFQVALQGGTKAYAYLSAHAATQDGSSPAIGDTVWIHWDLDSGTFVDR